MSENSVKVAVVGASGYTGQELLRLLINHPQVDLVAVTSRQEKGRPLTEVFPRFAAIPSISDLAFIDADLDQIVASGATYAFLALPHGVASEFAGPLVKRGLRVIDLSADYRISDPAVYEDFYGLPHPDPELLKSAVYGLGETHAEAIKTADLVASPGCYPTSILTPLIPLLQANCVDPQTITIASMSGVSGAGKKADTSLLFAEVNESIRAYGAPKHRHLSEIEQELSRAAGDSVRVSFVPHLMPITAGIATTIFADLKPGGAEKVATTLNDYYAESGFVRILGEGKFADTKNVVRTNFIDIGWVVDPRTDRLILSSAEDNLGKGAGAQAIQSMNLMCGWPETCGLLNV